MMSWYRGTWMPRDAIFRILEAVRPMLVHPTKRSCALSPETQLLVTLRFLSKGGFLLEMGDLHGVSDSSVSRAFERTLDALCSELPALNFPEPTSQNKLHQDFYKIAGFSSCNRGYWWDPYCNSQTTERWWTCLCLQERFPCDQRSGCLWRQAQVGCFLWVFFNSNNIKK